MSRKKIIDESHDLIHAIQVKNVNQVETILSDNINLLSMRNGGLTPLDIAIRNGFVKIVEILLKMGADIDADVKNNINPYLLDAIYNDNIPMVETLMKQPNKSLQNTIKNKSIFKAKSVKMAEFLIQHGANINAVRDDEENTIAHTFWSSYNNLKLTKFLLKQGLDLTVKNRNGLTAVEYCRTLLIEEDIPKLIQKYDRNRTETITLMVLAYTFDENSLVNKDNIGKDMFLLIMGSLK